MRYLIFILMILSTLVQAGPAIDNARAVMDSLQGSPVSNVQGLTVLDAFGDSFGPARTLNTEEKAQIFLNQLRTWTLRVRNNHRAELKLQEQAAERQVLDDVVEAERIPDL
jgi:hypothetical protein